MTNSSLNYVYNYATAGDTLTLEAGVFTIAEPSLNSGLDITMPLKIHGA